MWLQANTVSDMSHYSNTSATALAKYVKMCLLSMRKCSIQRTSPAHSKKCSYWEATKKLSKLNTLNPCSKKWHTVNWYPQPKTQRQGWNWSFDQRNRTHCPHNYKVSVIHDVSAFSSNNNLSFKRGIWYFISFVSLKQCSFFSDRMLYILCPLTKCW